MSFFHIAPLFDLDRKPSRRPTGWQRYRASILLGATIGLLTRIVMRVSFTPVEAGILVFCILAGYFVWLCCRK